MCYLLVLLFQEKEVTFRRAYRSCEKEKDSKDENDDEDDDEDDCDDLPCFATLFQRAYDYSVSVLSLIHFVKHNKIITEI